MDPQTIAAQTEEFMALLARAQALGLRSQHKAVQKATGGEFSIVDARSVGHAYAQAAAHFARDPSALMRFGVDLWTDAATAWWNAWTTDAEGSGDRRFRDERWTADRLSRALRDVHLAMEGAVDRLTQVLPPGDKDSLRVQFYTRQLMSALSPSNFLALNPAARERFLETDGRSLLDGFRNLLDDLERGDGRLDISMTDREAFRVGRDLATTPGQVIWQNELMQLIHYAPLTASQHRRPLLFVPPWINKYYIFDMRKQPGPLYAGTGAQRVPDFLGQPDRGARQAEL